ncbi:MAG TPA: DUF2914 domain-containing protein [Polyangiaceae bacterium]|jgi:hypothetical protein
MDDSRWVAVSALGAAMFAIGFSVTGVACNGRDTSVSEAARGASSASAVPAPAASLGTVATVVNAAPSVVPSASAATAHDAEAEGLKLKRFVVTHKIENREPVPGDDFSVGNTPVYAFAELENATPSPRGIRVLFENEDTKASVGHVKLTVPAAQQHYRTWGNTRLIRDPGHWVAVVTTADGVELGRAPFQVKG